MTMTLAFYDSTELRTNLNNHNLNTIEKHRKIVENQGLLSFGAI